MSELFEERLQDLVTCLKQLGGKVEDYTRFPSERRPLIDVLLNIHANVEETWKYEGKQTREATTYNSGWVSLFSSVPTNSPKPKVSPCIHEL